MNLTGLTQAKNRIYGLFLKWKGNTSQIQLARVHGNKLAPYGKPVNLQGQFTAKLGASTSDVNDGLVDVGIQDANSSKRWIATYGSDGWKSSDLTPNQVEGFALSGPVRTPESVVMPVVENNFDTGNWPFLTYVWKDHEWVNQDGVLVGQETGASQGGIDPVGQTVWATWSRMMVDGSMVGGKRIPTEEWAAKIDPDTGEVTERIRLWKGGLYWPPQTQAVEYRGNPVFLYMRQFRTRGGMRATVRFQED